MSDRRITNGSAQSAESAMASGRIGSMSEGRNRNGTFAVGNSGGPGRPRRTIEREYLAALLDSVSLDSWRAIIAKAVDDAKQGDAKAREWLARYLVGAEPQKPSALAADEAELTADEEIERIRKRRSSKRREEDITVSLF